MVTLSTTSCSVGPCPPSMAPCGSVQGAPLTPLSSPGPDICGPGTKKVHVIFNYKGKNVLINKDIRCKVCGGVGCVRGWTLPRVGGMS